MTPEIHTIAVETTGDTSTVAAGGQFASQTIQHVTVGGLGGVVILAEIRDERRRQDEKFGEQNWPDGTGGPGRILDADEARAECQRQAAEGTLRWVDILDEEVAEAYAETDPAKLRVELVQVAAVVAAWIEAIDRRTAGAE